MAITSYGYAGTVNAPQWATLIPLGGVDYGVASYSDWRPTIGGAGDRAITIAAGRGYGHGVADDNSAPVTLNLPSVSSGSRWDLIAANRVWGTKVTSFVRVAGSATKALPVRENTPGTEDDQPIALARVQAGSTTIAELVDLRCVPGNSGMVAFSDFTLTYLTRIGTQVRIGSTLWQRVLSNLGTPTWASVDVSGFTIGTPTLGPNWSATSGYLVRVQRAGQMVELSGAVTISSGASFTNILTVPVGYRPTANRWLGAVRTSGGVQVNLHLNASGLLTAVYQAGSMSGGTVLPLQGVWMTLG